jgi:hypothetical protein
MYKELKRIITEVGHLLNRHCRDPYPYLPKPAYSGIATVLIAKLFNDLTGCRYLALSRLILQANCSEPQQLRFSIAVSRAPVPAMGENDPERPYSFFRF